MGVSFTAMTEALDGKRPIRVTDSIIPVIPSSLSGHDRERWIELAARILNEYPTVRQSEMSGERRYRLGTGIGAIRIKTTKGYVYPTFQFEENGGVHWLVRVSALSLRDDLARGDWWTKPNESLSGKIPASLLGTRRPSEELRALVISLQSN